eukprot:258835_1
MKIVNSKSLQTGITSYQQEGHTDSHPTTKIGLSKKAKCVMLFVVLLYTLAIVVVWAGFFGAKSVYDQEKMTNDELRAMVTAKPERFKVVLREIAGKNSGNTTRVIMDIFPGFSPTSALQQLRAKVTALNKKNIALKSTVENMKPIDIDNYDAGKWCKGRYEGEVNIKGEPHGHGKIANESSGLSYSGDWLNGLPNGMGIWKDDNKWGTVYKGEWKDGKIHGFGKAAWDIRKSLPEKETYIGEWKMDEHEGYGRYSFATGDSYQGEWKKNAITGRGVWITKDGSIHWDGFKNNSFVPKL